jgi:hypothetical protein
MFDNSITLNGTGQLTGVTPTSATLDRVTQDGDGAGSLWRMPSTALTQPLTLVVKHDVRKGRAYQYQASSMKHSFTLNDSTTGEKCQFDIGFFINVPQGTFASNVQTETQKAVANLLSLIRADNILMKLMNMEG